MSSFALYRLPYADSYTEIRQTGDEAEEIRTLGELCGKNGFLIAPFAVTDDCPVLLIRPDTVVTENISHLKYQETDSEATTIEDNHNSYATNFANYHAKLVTGEFRKIVLARTAIDETSKEISPRILFARACKLYPRMFVALVSTPKSGTWLMATPEMLLEWNSTEWRTMALAGTMRLSDEQLSLDNPPRQGRNNELKNISWSIKNKTEQHFVASYIREQLEHFTDNLSEEGPYTVRAGNLIHLRSDFKFTISNTSRIGELIDALHPTPAVCGLPKDKTFRFITSNEARPRRYYSGFMGPLNLSGNTHLFVSLRCMEICGRQYRLYAGGGLLGNSTEENEWKETEAKMETMRLCIQTKRT